MHIYLILKFYLFLFQFLYLCLQIVDSNLSNMCFSISEDQAALIESLVGSKGHFQIITNPHQQYTSLGQVNCSLTDNLIEKLIMDVFSDWADSTFASLFFDHFRLKYFLQLFEFISARLFFTHIQSKIAAICFKDVWFKHFI